MTITDSLVRTEEQRLLVLAARTFLEPKARDDLREQVERGPDWQRFLACALENKVLPLVYRVLSAEAADLVPEEALAELRRRYRENAQRNLQLTAELLRLVGRLEEQGIPTLPVKGPLLAARLFGDLGLRQFSDLDLLVRSEDYDRALTVVESCGYEVVLPGVLLTPAQRVAQVRWHIGYHLVLRHQSHGTQLELHWALFYRDRFFPVGASSFWQELATTELAGRTVSDLPTCAMLRYLCIHGSGDRWASLSRVIDVAVALRCYEHVDWGPMLDKAVSFGVRRALLLGPYLAHRLFGSLLPSAVLHQISDQEDALAEAARLCDLFRERNQFRWPLYGAVLREGAIAKLGEILSLIVQPECSTIEAVRLPPRAFPAYYALRPVQIFARDLVWRPLVQLFGFGARGS